MTDLQQLVYTWSANTLTGPGYGIVALTSHWTGSRSTRDGEYAHWFNRHDLDAATGGFTLRYLPHFEHGSLLVIKREAGQDGVGRPGRYVVHLILDPTRAMNAADAITLAHDSATSVWPLDASPTAALPPPTAERPDASHPDPAVLAALLECLDTATDLTLQRSSDGLAAAMAALPEGLDQTPLTNYPVQERPSLLVTWDPTHVRLSSDQGAEPRDNAQPAYQALAADFLACRTRAKVPPLSSVAETRAWVEQRLLAATPADRLTVPELLGQFRGGSAAQRIQECEREIVRRETSSALTDEERTLLSQRIPASSRDKVAAALIEVLARDRTRDVLGIAATWRAPSDATRRLADVVLDAYLGGDTMSPQQQESLVPWAAQTVTRTKNGARFRAILKDDWLADVLTDQWGPVSERITGLYWVSGQEPIDGLQEAAARVLRRHPRQVSALIRSANPPDERTERAVRSLPAGYLKDAVQVLVTEAPSELLTPTPTPSRKSSGSQSPSEHSDERVGSAPATGLSDVPAPKAAPMAGRWALVVGMAFNIGVLGWAATQGVGALVLIVAIMIDVILVIVSLTRRPESTR